MNDPIRHDWSLPEVHALFGLPFMDLILSAQRVHRAHHAPNTVQMSTLLSIKTGACPEDCAYCPQSVRYDTGVAREALMEVAAVRELPAARTTPNRRSSGSARRVMRRGPVDNPRPIVDLQHGLALTRLPPLGHRPRSNERPDPP